MKNMTKEKLVSLVQELTVLKKHDIIKFHSTLRGYIKNSYSYGFDFFEFMIHQFQFNILKSGIFYIDDINSNLFFLFKASVNKKFDDKEALERFIVLIEIIEKIGNYQLHLILKKIRARLSNKFSEEKERIIAVEKRILINVNKMELSVQQYLFEKEEDIIVKWY